MTGRHFHGYIRMFERPTKCPACLHGCMAGSLEEEGKALLGQYHYRFIALKHLHVAIACLPAATLSPWMDPLAELISLEVWMGELHGMALKGISTVGFKWPSNFEIGMFRNGSEEATARGATVHSRIDIGFHTTLYGIERRNSLKRKRGEKKRSLAL